MGGGYIVCGAAEETDEHGFPRLVATGLAASRRTEIEIGVTEGLLKYTTPPLVPRIDELPADDPGRRVLVFTIPASGAAHQYRQKDGSAFWIRVGRSTVEARNGALRELLARKGVVPHWDRRPAVRATLEDIDLLALREALQRMGAWDEKRSVEAWLNPDQPLTPLAPPLAVRESLSGIVRPANFSLLLFGRAPTRFAPGAWTRVSVYPGTDRATDASEIHDVGGTLIQQADRVVDLLQRFAPLLVDKTSPLPNVPQYPHRALQEATVNALVHRDYEDDGPTRVTVFADRIEITSPGGLARTVDAAAFAAADAPPVWRNQALAWFFLRLQLAQAEGHGLPTIQREMLAAGCPPPRFVAEAGRVVCVLPAHPRQRLAEGLRRVGAALRADELDAAWRELRAIWPAGASDGESQFILPMSNFALGSTTRGTRLGGPISTCSTARSDAARQCSSAGCRTVPGR